MWCSWLTWGTRERGWERPPLQPCWGIAVRQGPARSRQDVRPRASEVGASPTDLRGHISLRSVTGLSPLAVPSTTSCVSGTWSHRVRVKDLTCVLLCSCVAAERDAAGPSGGGGPAPAPAPAPPAAADEPPAHLEEPVMAGGVLPDSPGWVSRGPHLCSR